MLKRLLLVFGPFALALYLPNLTRVVWPPLTALVLAGILAIALDRANQWIGRRVHSPGLVTVLAAFVIVSVLGAMLAFTSVKVMSELKANHALLKEHALEEGGWMALVTQTADQGLDLAYSPLAVGFNLDRSAVPVDAIRTGSIESLQGASGVLETDTVLAFGSTKSFWITGVLTALFLCLLLRYGAGWTVQVQDTSKGRADDLVAAVHTWVVENTSDTFAGAAAEGVLIGLGFWFAGVRSPVLLGAISGVASLTPLVGSPVIWAPVAVSFFAMGDYWRGIALALWGVLIVAGMEKAMTRFVAEGRDRQHPMAVAAAAIGGTYALGILGVLLIPMAFAVVAAVLNKVHALIS